MRLSNEEVIRLQVLLDVLLHNTAASLRQAKSMEEHATLEGYQDTICWWIERLSRMEPGENQASIPPHTIPESLPCCVCGASTFLACQDCDLAFCLNHLTQRGGTPRCQSCALDAESEGRP